MNWFWQSEWKTLKMPFRAVPSRGEDFLGVDIEAVGSPDGVSKYFLMACMFGGPETTESEYDGFMERLVAAAGNMVDVQLKYRGGKLRGFKIEIEDLVRATGCELCRKLEVLGWGISDQPRGMEA